jgi:hypothetical protein
MIDVKINHISVESDRLMISINLLESLIVIFSSEELDFSERVVKRV